MTTGSESRTCAPATARDCPATASAPSATRRRASLPTLSLECQHMPCAHASTLTHHSRAWMHVSLHVYTLIDIHMNRRRTPGARGVSQPPKRGPEAAHPKWGDLARHLAGSHAMWVARACVSVVLSLPSLRSPRESGVLGVGVNLHNLHIENRVPSVRHCACEGQKAAAQGHAPTHRAAAPQTAPATPAKTPGDSTGDRSDESTDADEPDGQSVCEIAGGGGATD